MRESRSPGSVRGVTSNGNPYRDERQQKIPDSGFLNQSQQLISETAFAKKDSKPTKTDTINRKLF